MDAALNGLLFSSVNNPFIFSLKDFSFDSISTREISLVCSIFSGNSKVNGISFVL